MLYIVDANAARAETPHAAHTSVEPADELNARRPYEVVVDPTGLCVEAWSTKRLPFEPKGWLRSLRAELRGELPGLYGGTRPCARSDVRVAGP
jgi:hypothetical protein